MKNILVFSHMMKTAGTSLSKQLIGHYGSRMHIVPGGLMLDDDYYDENKFEEDLIKSNHNLKIVTGHPMRAYIDFGEYEKNMVWFTFFREPKKRFVSHYLHDYKWTGNFGHKNHRKMKNKSIVEWDKFYNFSNYQTRFIAGEENFDKAVELLETKISWVGITEKYEESLYSFKSHFKLHNFHFEIERSNTNLADQKIKKSVHKEYADFIKEKNEIDIRLYNYVLKRIWPKFERKANNSMNKKGKNKLSRTVNTFSFHINRQLKYRTSEVNIDNIKRFYRRWYR